MLKPCFKLNFKSTWINIINENRKNGYQFRLIVKKYTENATKYANVFLINVFEKPIDADSNLRY